MSEENNMTTTAATTEPTANIYAALVAVQKKIPKIVKGNTVSFKSVKYKYADLESILSIVRPLLNDAGIFLSQDLTSEGTEVKCRTVLYSVDGSHIESGYVAVPATGGNNDAQARGSAATYARRYSLCATLGISADDDDDALSACDTAPAARQATSASECPLELKRRADAAARHGISAYKAFFKEIENSERAALANSGVHAAMKKKAEEASK